MNEFAREAIPLEWVPLDEAAVWIERMHDVPAKKFDRDLRLEIRDGTQVRYRIALVPRLGSMTLPSTPPGMDWEHSYGSVRVFVRDWSVAGVDWNTCTVVGWRRHGSEPERAAIEVWWGDVERWSMFLVTSVQAKRRREAKRLADQQTMVPAATSRPARLTRKPQGLDYRCKDRPLVEEALIGIRAGRFRNATDAARQLAGKAEGASEGSKVARLIKRIGETLSP